MKYPPPIDLSYDELPLDAEKRHKFLEDVFGKYLFWALNEADNDVKLLVESAEARKQLGRLPAKPFEEAASKLSGEQREIAFNLAHERSALFAKRLLAILTAQGISHRFGDKHVIQFRLVLEIRDAEELSLVDEEVINRGGQRAFFNCWGRWLNQNSNRQAGEERRDGAK